MRAWFLCAHHQPLACLGPFWTRMAGAAHARGVPCWLHAGRTAAVPAAEHGPAGMRPEVHRGVRAATTGLQGWAADPGGAGMHACPAMGIQGPGLRFGSVGPGAAQGAPEKASAAAEGVECVGRGGPGPCKAKNGHLTSTRARSTRLRRSASTQRRVSNCRASGRHCQAGRDARRAAGAGSPCERLRFIILRRALAMQCMCHPGGLC